MSNRLFLFLCMLFLHIVDDFYLQGWLANGKQKVWWEKQTQNSLYKFDYIAALVIHSFSWTFMVMLPVAAWKSFRVTPSFLIGFLWNVCLHGVTDDLKANKLKINLIIDQLIHFIQISLTALIFLH